MAHLRTQSPHIQTPDGVTCENQNGAGEEGEEEAKGRLALMEV